MEEMPRSRWNDSRAVGRWFASILRSAPKPLAVFCPGPAESSRVAAECRACGIAVPEEVAILCTGDDQMPCENQAVPLSCIIVGGERQGYEAAALLDRLIDGEEPPKEAVTVPPGGIAVRASTDRIAASNPVVAKALALIAENLARPWGVAQLCAALGVEPRTLHRRFVEELGRSPSREILRQRLAKARKLLGDTDMTLAEIAAQCGLCHASYLSNLFRRETGLSPRVWRRSRES
jgi:LacI family transcriptional regulator